MSADWELWGTFSVSDHLRPDPFAADVLLFDRLAIPAATPDDVDRWSSIGRRPELQSEVLEVLRDLPGWALYEIPWDDEKRRYFHDNYADPAPPISTQALTTAVRFDVMNVQEAKREHPDSDGQFQTRIYLRDVLDAENDRKLFAGVPAVEVDVVAAYGSSGEMCPSGSDTRSGRRRPRGAHRPICGDDAGAAPTDPGETGVRLHGPRRWSRNPDPGPGRIGDDGGYCWHRWRGLCCIRTGLRRNTSSAFERRHPKRGHRRTVLADAASARVQALTDRPSSRLG